MYSEYKTRLDSAQRVYMYVNVFVCLCLRTSKRKLNKIFLSKQVAKCIYIYLQQSQCCIRWSYFPSLFFCNDAYSFTHSLCFRSCSGSGSCSLLHVMKEKVVWMETFIHFCHCQRVNTIIHLCCMFEHCFLFVVYFLSVYMCVRACVHVRAMYTFIHFVQNNESENTNRTLNLSLLHAIMIFARYAFVHVGVFFFLN